MRESHEEEDSHRFLDLNPQLVWGKSQNKERVKKI